MPTTPSVGLRSLSVAVPPNVKTNDHWRRHHPRVVAETEERIWMWKKPADYEEGSRAFNEEMEPFVLDPFRGARERRFLEPDETVLSLEARAARDAMERAGLEPDDVDLLICTSFLPDHAGIGGSAWLARELGLRGAAWNLESACSSSLLALTTATNLIRAGQHRNVLVVTSCCYSKVTVEDDPVCWGIGDAATAMVVGEVEAGTGLLGAHSLHSAETCGAITYELENHPERGEPFIRLRPQRTAARLLRENSEPYLRACAQGALERAGLEMGDVDHLVVNTPLAWYAAFCARTLGVPRDRTISVYPLYANVGPALLGLNLLHRAHWKRFSPDDVVLLYTVGSVSSSAAAVVRWGDVALGELPDEVDVERIEAMERQAAAERESVAEAAAVA